MAQSDDEREAAIRRHCAVGAMLHCYNAEFILSRLDAARAERVTARARAETMRIAIVAISNIAQVDAETLSDARRLLRHCAKIANSTADEDKAGIVARPPPPSPNGARSAEEERADVVAWHRREANAICELMRDFRGARSLGAKADAHRDAAKFFESGAHIGAATKGGSK